MIVITYAKRCEMETLFGSAVLASVIFVIALHTLRDTSRSRAKATTPHVATLAVIALIALSVTGAHAQERTIDQFFNSFTDEWMRFNSDAAAASRYFTGEEQDRVERQMSPRTRENQIERIRLAQKGLAGLRRFDRSKLTPPQRVSADLMDWQLDIFVKGEPFADLAFPLEQFGGANIDLVNTLTVQHPLKSEKDADNYLARLALVGTRMNEAIAETQRVAKLGTIPPRFILNATISQMQQFVASPPAQNPLVATFDERLRTGNVVPEARRAELRAQVEKIVTSEVYPAWRTAIGVLQEQLPLSTDAAGISNLKNGEAAYAHHLARFTSTTLTADEIHQIGLREVARLEQEMDVIFKQLGRSTGTIPERIKQLKNDQGYPITPEGRAAVMTDINGILKDSLARSALLFDHMPKAAVIAQPFPEFRWPNAAANYTAPPLDGSRPGIFQMPLRPDRMTKLGLRTLVYHETVPGHHFQIALMNEDASLPRFRQIRAFGGISSITEGWALYAERLAAEQGWYDGDPEGHLGELDGALWRARRLVVDTGLHTKGWTRQQAIDYGIEASEIERYVVNPGQATSYMIGQLRIIALRDKAKAALGPKFSFKAFHNAVLAVGSVPLDILESEVDAYIRAAGAS
ncbi:MAG: DUF885 domain-containing protein [Rhodospirillaceae bacterium]|nr:DUF885 domain-containing protein [Rhodospirillaceae bacterium]